MNGLCISAPDTPPGGGIGSCQRRGVTPKNSRKQKKDDDDGSSEYDIDPQKYPKIEKAIMTKMMTRIRFTIDSLIWSSSVWMTKMVNRMTKMEYRICSVLL